MRIFKTSTYINVFFQGPVSKGQECANCGSQWFPRIGGGGGRQLTTCQDVGPGPFSYFWHDYLSLLGGNRGAARRRLWGGGGGGRSGHSHPAPPLPDTDHQGHDQTGQMATKHRQLAMIRQVRWPPVTDHQGHDQTGKMATRHRPLGTWSDRSDGHQTQTIRNRIRQVRRPPDTDHQGHDQTIRDMIRQVRWPPDTDNQGHDQTGQMATRHRPLGTWSDRSDRYQAKTIRIIIRQVR